MQDKSEAIKRKWICFNQNLKYENAKNHPKDRHSSRKIYFFIPRFLENGKEVAFDEKRTSRGRGAFKAVGLVAVSAAKILR